ncbi:MAG: hypothetical protein Q8P18_27595 [Pseudomonadota bacterium]|nr:hypothetical protein [Pseudomonadota bacterium]
MEPVPLPAPPPAARPRESKPLARALAHPLFAPLFFGVLAIVWTWPLVLSPNSATMALHFDQLTAAWLVHAAPTFLDGVSELSAWPEGGRIVRLDSFVFLFLSLALSALPGLLVTNLFVLVGPVLSAWAAERLAREGLGVGRPASLVAGVAFGFAPLATVAVLEGHIYYLLDPWLPLCALYTWTRRPWPAVAMFALSLLTTAYLGVNALLVLLAILAHQRRLDLRLLGGVGVVGALYAALFLGGSTPPGESAGAVTAEIGSATLTTLVAWNGWMDLNRHSLAPVIGLFPLCFALLAPFARVSFCPWLPLGLVAAVCAVGPILEAGVVREAGVPTLLWPFHLMGVFAVYRFPVRFAWITALALGVASALVVDRMRWRWLAVGFAVVDALVLSGAVFRMRLHPTPTPSLYALLPDAPLLDLYPQIGSVQEDPTFYNQNLSCYYQLFHLRPIMDPCLNTNIRQGPRLRTSDELHGAVLDGRSVLPALYGARVGSVVMHADLYQPFERAAVMAGLSAELGAPMAEGHDGGEWLLAWRVPEAP